VEFRPGCALTARASDSFQVYKKGIQMSAISLFERLDAGSESLVTVEAFSAVLDCERAVREQELVVSRLALDVAWLAAKTQDALDALNENWREEQMCRRVIKYEEAYAAKYLGWQVEVGFLRSWVDVAGDVRYRMDGRYCWSNHYQSEAEDELKAARAVLRDLRKKLFRAVQTEQLLLRA